MRALPSASMVCRVLLGLDRASASGTLRLRGEGRSATLCLEAGRVAGANVDRRVASSHRQLFESLLVACRWEGVVLRLERESAAATWWRLDEPLPAGSLALRTMRTASRHTGLETIRSDLGAGVYHLTEVGEWLVRGAELRSEETSAVFWLRRGVCADDVLVLPGCGVAGYRFVWTLKLLRGAGPKPAGSYPLLLRKQRELRRKVSARALLDLPEGAGGREARRALRTLVRDLHPDRFGAGAPPALRRASGEIVTALVNAEAAIASGASE